MEKQQFNKLTHLEQLEYVNEKLKNGESLRNISAELNISKTTIRDRFKKIGYLFDAELHQYCKSDTSVNKEHNSITHESIIKVSQENKIDIKENKSLKNSNTLELQKYKNDLIDLIENKNDILEMLREYKRNTKVIELPQLDITDLPSELKGAIVNKSIKVYDDIYKLFDELCTQYKGIKKQDLLSLALLEFYDKYKKK